MQGKRGPRLGSPPKTARPHCSEGCTPPPLPSQESLSQAVFLCLRGRQPKGGDQYARGHRAHPVCTEGKGGGLRCPQGPTQCSYMCHPGAAFEAAGCQVGLWSCDLTTRERNQGMSGDAAPWPPSLPGTGKSPFSCSSPGHRPPAPLHPLPLCDWEKQGGKLATRSGGQPFWATSGVRL